MDKIIEKNNPPAKAQQNNSPPQTGSAQPIHGLGTININLQMQAALNQVNLAPQVNQMQSESSENVSISYSDTTCSNTTVESTLSTNNNQKVTPSDESEANVPENKDSENVLTTPTLAEVDNSLNLVSTSSMKKVSIDNFQ